MLNRRIILVVIEVKILKAAEDYLETMLMLKEKHGYIRSIDIAEERGVTKASVSYSTKRLRENGYITVDGKPIFFIWDPYRFKDIEGFMHLWNRLAAENNLQGIYFVAIGNSTTTIKRRSDGTVEPGRIQPDLKSSAKVYNDFLALGFNAVCSIGKSRAEMIYMGKYKRALRFMLQERLPFLLPSFKYDYPKVMKYSFAPEDSWENVFPAIMPQWDRSPRSGNKEGIYINATPEHFKHHIEDALKVIANKQPEHKILILRSWNEWGEGNYVEPDLKYGHGFLNALKNCINE
jgi:hypothetical protein